MVTQTQPRGMAATTWVASLCWIAVVLDGFDLVVLGALIPTLTGGESPFMTKPEATFVSTISLVGMTLGALTIGLTVANRLQHRRHRDDHPDYHG